MAGASADYAESCLQKQAKRQGLGESTRHSRHSFGSDMIRAGVSLPALQRLMGHANIETTLLYVQISPQDVYEEYARAVARRVAPARIAQP